MGEIRAGGTDLQERRNSGVSRGPVVDLQDLDGPLLLLASDASAYMNGSVVEVDGGHLVSTL